MTKWTKEYRQQYMIEYRKRTDYARKRYLANKPEYYESNVRQRKLRSQWFQELKSKLSCVACGENDPTKLHFHHKDPSTKIANVSYMVMQRYTKEKILAEIEKCDPLCQECHGVLHSSATIHILDDYII